MYSRSKKMIMTLMESLNVLPIVSNDASRAYDHSIEKLVNHVNVELEANPKVSKYAPMSFW
jgi:hypothetical protein